MDFIAPKFQLQWQIFQHSWILGLLPSPTIPLFVGFSIVIIVFFCVFVFVVVRIDISC